MQTENESCLKITQFMFNDNSLNEFLNFVLIECLTQFNADRGSIFLLDKHKQCLRGFFMTGIERPCDVILKLDQGIIGYVVRTGESLNILDAYQDKRFYSEIDAKTGYKTKAILCVPLKSWNYTENKASEILGCLELLNPKNKEFFTENDVQSLQNILSFATVRLKEYSLIEGLLESQQRLQIEVAKIKGYTDENNVLSEIIGVSDTIEKLKQRIWAVAFYDTPVLITGENGTGKELVAHCLHRLSNRKHKPFIALNCAAIPENILEAELFGTDGAFGRSHFRKIGKIEQANGGTLFLENITEIPITIQFKLLRFLKENEIIRIGAKESIAINVRIIGSSEYNLLAEIKNKRFREDFYYLLKVAEIYVEPLKGRKEDISYLAMYFLDNLNKKYYQQTKRTLNSDSLLLLQTLDWPGNIKQLEHELEHLYILAGEKSYEINPELIYEMRKISQYNQLEIKLKNNDQQPEEYNTLVISTENKELSVLISEMEQQLVNRYMKQFAGNKSKVAEKLGISREGLRKMFICWEEKT